MTANKRIKEHIDYTTRPFTSLEVMNELGICYETVKKYLQTLIADGYIKMIGKDKGKNVYVRSREQNSKSYKVNQKHYTLKDVQEAYRRQIQKRRDELDDLL